MPFKTPPAIPPQAIKLWQEYVALMENFPAISRGARFMPSDHSHDRLEQDPCDVIRSLLGLIAGKDGRSAPTSKFCVVCEGKVRHDSTIRFCSCPCHAAVEYLEQHGES